MSHNAQRKAQVPSSNSARQRTLDFDITIVNTAVERSFPLYAPDNTYSFLCCTVTVMLIPQSLHVNNYVVMRLMFVQYGGDQC